MQEHRHFPFAMRSRFGLSAPTTWFTYTDFAETSMADFVATVTDHNITELPAHGQRRRRRPGGGRFERSLHGRRGGRNRVDRHVECLREAVGAVSA